MLIAMLLRHPYVVALTWAAMYIFDYVSTIQFARFYAATLKEHIEYEGGVELNPVFERDIARLRRVSPRFVVLLIVFFIILLGIGLLDAGGFEFVAGVYLLLWLFIDLRHLRNYYLRWLLHARPASMQGQIKQSYWLSQRLVGFDAFIYGMIYLSIYFAVGRIFFLGGAAVCCVTALRQTLLANRKPRITVESER